MNIAPRSSLNADVKDLAGKSLIYGLGSVLLRSLSLLVLPLYTRYLSPADYGVVALGSSLTALLSLILPIGLYNAVARFYFIIEAREERRRVIGTIWLAMLGIGLVISLLLDMVGATLFEAVFPQLEFNPYVRISIWTAYLTLFSFVPLNLFQVQERPGAFVWWTGAILILTVALTILFVVILEKGAYGYLLATLIANAIFAIPYVVVTIRDADFCLDFTYLSKAIKFSLPLVPHGLSSWVLAVSDRAILQFYVSVSALGIYSLGYTFGMIQITISAAINQAFIPFLFKRVAEEGGSAEPRLARLVTYYTLTICTVAVGLCIFAKEIIYFFTAEPFHSAYQVVPIIVLGYLWNGLYVIPLNFLFLKSRTELIPIGTVTAGFVNVAINYLFVQDYGIMTAAWATFVAFFVMLILVFFFSNRIYPFPYEYRRIAGILSSAGIIILLGLNITLPLYIGILFKIVLFLMYALLLLLCGFLYFEEKLVLMGYFDNLKERIKKS